VETQGTMQKILTYNNWNRRMKTFGEERRNFLNLKTRSTLANISVRYYIS